MADIKTFAADLKAVREEKNLTLKGISQQTRLSVSILENIENGDFTFQPQAYIRAFLKQYINSLDLDMDETLFDYDLARSGKYTPKQSSYPSEEKNISSQAEDSKSNRTKITEKLKGIVDTPKKTTPEKKVEKTEDVTPGNIKQSKEEIREELRKELREELREELKEELKEEIPEVKPEINDGKNEIRETREIKTETKYVQKRPEEKYYTTANNRSREKKKFSFSFLNSPAIRNIFMILFALLVLLGIYSLINILFLEGSKDKPEVIRQNFDDVVKEQEKKILGKRTTEEIQDSIRKAEEEFAAAGDSITLKITGLVTGTFYLVTDSVNYSKPEKISFEKGETGIFKARKYFFVSLENTESVKATVNDKPLKFDNKKVSKVKISRSGIVK